jgi:hypothetical protein
VSVSTFYTLYTDKNYAHTRNTRNTHNTLSKHTHKYLSADCAHEIGIDDDGVLVVCVWEVCVCVLRVSLVLLPHTCFSSDV